MKDRVTAPRSFLKPMQTGSGQGLVLRNQRTGAVVAVQLLPALNSQARRTGLLKHEGLPDDVAMVIAPTNAIHTFFMKFPIDIAFVTREGRIVKIRHKVPAWRIAAAWGGYAVVEMAAGSFERANCVRGDTLAIGPA